MKYLNILFLTLILFSGAPIVIAQDYVENSYFTVDLSNWSISTVGNANTAEVDRPTSGGYEDANPFARIKSYCTNSDDRSGYTQFTQDVDVTGYEHLSFMWRTSLYTTPDERGGHLRVYIGNQYLEHSSVTDWASGEIDIVGSGIQTITCEAHSWTTVGSGPASAQLMVDNLVLTDYNPNSTLDGYITRDNTPLESATITLNNSGGDTTSNESGYYLISDIEPGSYSVVVSKVGYNLDTTIIDLSSNQIHNVSLIYETPVLESLSILDSGDNSLLLGWKESLGADGVYVYVDSQTNLVAIVETPYTNIKMYDLTNLVPGTSYNIWCKPYKDAILGSMYYVSGTTTGGGGGGGGGGAVEVLPPYDDIQPEIPEYPEIYDMTNITSSDLITLAATNPEVIYEALSNITIKSPLPDKPGDNLLYFYLLIISICSTLFSSKKEGWEAITIISVVVVVISLIKLGWI